MVRFSLYFYSLSGLTDLSTVSQLVGWLVGWLVSWSVSRSVGWSVGQLVSRLCKNRPNGDLTCVMVPVYGFVKDLEHLSSLIVGRLLRYLNNKFVRTKMRLKLGTKIDLSERFVRFVRLIGQICQKEGDKIYHFSASAWFLVHCSGR